MSTTRVIPNSRRVVFERTIHVIECASCSIDFGIGDEFMGARRRDGQGFYCPNGHSNVYPDDTEAKQLERVRRRERSLQASLVHERDQRDAAEKSARAHKGHATRLRNRAKAGVCPCCQRTFQQLKRHMDGQHPDWPGNES